MNILLATDNNFVMPTGVLMHSIGINNTSSVTYYVMVNPSFSDENRDVLTEIANQYGHKVSFVRIDDSITGTLPFGRKSMPSHVSIATYYRLFITNLLPVEVHKILYLDGDIIVRKSLEELWETDISGFALGAVRDMLEESIVKSNHLPYPMSVGYFNAGVLLINVDYWRNNCSLEKFLIFIEENYDTIKYHDQDVLNATFHDEVKWLSCTYNFQNGFLYEKQLTLENNDVENCKNDPAIIHFTTASKPWQIDCYHPYGYIWRKYKKLSRWRNKRLDGDDPKNLKQHIKFFLLRNNLWLPNIGYQRIRIY